ncbi:hypothetical protein [Methanoregula sp.]|jgi:hypothetical protein|uniref:hypothetical protein n=1 Tax=Methanoregula sp. TaxID=2052170 RepID=UPI003565BECB
MIEKKMQIVIAGILIALLIGGAIGYLAGNSTGYSAGIAYEKTQPVNVTVYAYSGHTIHATDYYDMAKEDRLTVGTPGDYERDFNITSYSIITQH